MPVLSRNTAPKPTPGDDVYETPDWNRYLQRPTEKLAYAVLLANDIRPNSKNLAKIESRGNRSPLAKLVRSHLRTAYSALGEGFNAQHGLIPDGSHERLEKRVKLSQFAHWAQLGLPGAKNPAAFSDLARQESESDPPAVDHTNASSNSAILGTKSSNLSQDRLNRVIGLMALHIRRTAINYDAHSVLVTDNSARKLKLKSLATQLEELTEHRTDRERSKAAGLSVETIRKMLADAFEIFDPNLWEDV